MSKYAQKISSYLIISVFVFLPFLNNSHIFYGTYVVKETFICLAALLAAVISLPGILGGKKAGINPYIYICLVFMALLMLSGAGNPAVNRTLYSEKIITWLSLLFIPAVCVMPSMEKITAAAVLSNLAVVIIGAIQAFLFFSGGNYYFFGNDEFGKRIYSVFGNPDIFAAYLTAIIPVIFYAYKLNKGKSLLALAVINILLLLFTQSLSGAFTLSILAIVWAAICLKGKRRVAVFAAVFIVVAAALWRITGVKNDSAVLRHFLWDSSVKMTSANPVFGVGAGNFRVLTPEFQAQALKDGNYPDYVSVHDEAYAHNDFLQMLSETGIAGCMAFAALICYPFYVYFRNRSRAPEDGYILFSMAGILIFSTANFPFEIPLIAAMYAVFSFKLSGEAGLSIQKPGIFLKTAAAAAVLGVAAADIYFIPDYLERGYLTAYMGYAAAKELKVNYPGFAAKAQIDYQLSFYTGIMKSREGDFNGAIKDFKRALELFPNFAGCIYNLGNAYYNSGDLQNASLCYRKLIDLNRAYAPAYNNLAIIEKKENNYKEAIRLLTQAEKWNPGLLEINYNLADAYYHEGDTEKKLIYLKKALQIKADYQPALELAKKSGFVP
jgi:O-antigen ligase/Flp pilus assembly protein TadD